MADKQKFYMINIEGVDGCGKQTVVSHLVEVIKAFDKFTPVVLDFPDYTSPTGMEVKAFLNGKYGNPLEISPTEASLFYTKDRMAYYSDKKIFNMKSDKPIILIGNRSHLSNIFYHGVKIFVENRTDFEFLEGQKEIEGCVWYLIKMIKYLHPLEITSNSLDTNLSDIKNVVLYHEDFNINLTFLKDRNREKDLHESNLKYLEAVNDFRHLVEDVIDSDAFPSDMKKYWRYDLFACSHGKIVKRPSEIAVNLYDRYISRWED